MLFITKITTLPYQVNSNSRLLRSYNLQTTFLVTQTVKAFAYNARDLGSIPGLGGSPGEGNGNPLQYSCLENLMDGGARQTTVRGIAKSRTRLSDFIFTIIYTQESFYSDAFANMLLLQRDSWEGLFTHIPENKFLINFQIFKNQLINFIFGFAVVLLLRGGFSSCREWGLLSSCGAWASGDSFSCCRVQALSVLASVVAACRLSCGTQASLSHKMLNLP